MKAVAHSNFWCPNLDKDIKVLVKSCVECHVVKNAPLGIPLPLWVCLVWPWKRVNLHYMKSCLSRGSNDKCDLL